MRVKRDGNILKSLQREISLNSRVVKSKKVATVTTTGTTLKN